VTIESSPVPTSARGELLRRIFAVTQSVTNPHVQADFRLVPPTLHVTPPIAEFVSDQTGGRKIALLSESEIASRHTRLLEARVSVLSGMYVPEGVLMLDVPSGTRPMAGYANSIRRNAHAHAELFKEIGAALSIVEQTFGQNLAPTGDYPLLRQFAAAGSEESSSGGTVYLLPPYNLGSGTRMDILSAIHQELVESQVVLTEQADFLVEQVSQSWPAR
jgi:hypothetical protein